MHIRYLILNAYGRGGTIRSTLSMASVLAERGHDVEVASVLRYAREPQMPVSPTVRLVSLTGHRPRREHPGSPASAARWASRVALRGADTVLGASSDPRVGQLSPATDHWVRRWARAQDDAVLVGTRHSLVLALARCRTDRQVVVGQEHNRHRKDATSRAVYSTDYLDLDALAVLTEGDAQSFRTVVGTGLPVHVLPNAVPHGWSPAPPDLATPVALAAGSLVTRKGFDLLLTAWDAVARRHPHWQLRIVGGGPQQADLEAMVVAAGLGGSVTLVGASDDVAGEMSAASVFVLSSRSEGLPMVILEAMATGLPVVAFDCPTGPRDLVVDEVTGLVVPARDTAALAEAISRVAADEPLRRRMGSAGAERAQQHYAPQALATRWETLFGELGDVRGLRLGR